MKAHLANECLQCPEEISRYFINEQLASDKFAAIVIDNALNCRIAKQNIQQTYPHIWNVRCASHAIIRKLKDR
ncbi:hypothetical protein RhiirA4_451566 [Rhizophagus irregularis]|uniref:DUF659 domain-containing protein n=1 Tax=Rhizophagus irregularis TaxID=588596 RepID=A0A2I1FVZ6_9GLOM|nr:hypothetical protein RhiirA4_451566 [Rhizophagus irregularis]